MDQSVEVFFFMLFVVFTQVPPIYLGWSVPPLLDSTPICYSRPGRRWKHEIYFTWSQQPAWVDAVIKK